MGIFRTLPEILQCKFKDFHLLLQYVKVKENIVTYNLHMFYLYDFLQKNKYSKYVNMEQSRKRFISGSPDPTTNSKPATAWTSTEGIHEPSLVQVQEKEREVAQRET